MRTEKVIAYYPKLKELTKQANASILLSQIYYWQKKMKREFYKTDKDFREELSMGQREFKTAKSYLRNFTFLKIKAKGIPAKTHYKLNLGLFEQFLFNKSSMDSFESYSDYLKSSEWKSIAKKIRKRDEFKCTKCNSSESLQVHHTSYDNIFNERNHLEDLILLCDCCHKKEHNIKEEV